MTVLERPDGLAADRLVDADIYALPGMEQGFHDAWKRLQDASPDIVWTDRNEGHWIALRGELVAEILADHERFSSRVIILPRSAGEEHSGLIPTTIDPPEHRWYRKQLNENLSLKFVRDLEPGIRKLAGELIDGFVDDGEVEFIEHYSAILPIRIFMDLVDLPAGDAPRLKYLTDMMTNPGSEMTMAEARDEMAAYLLPVVTRRMENPGEDMISRMVGRPFEGRSMTAEEALVLTLQVLVAGMDTVVNFLGFAMLHLAGDEEMRRRLIADPDLAPRAVAELFRRYGSVTIARIVRQDMEYHGIHLRAGDLVACPTVVHGVDERENEDPMSVDIDRARPRHSAFGQGPHRCPGQELARSEVAITLQEWLRRIPDFTVANASELRQAGGINAHIDRLVLRWDG
tara:strand:+ start:23293 stop:24495 length:1203 start_codon:yes stop_codon:yes gene_type:complete